MLETPQLRFIHTNSRLASRFLLSSDGMRHQTDRSGPREWRSSIVRWSVHQQHTSLAFFRFRTAARSSWGYGNSSSSFRTPYDFQSLYNGQVYMIHGKMNQTTNFDSGRPTWITPFMVVLSAGADSYHCCASPTLLKTSRSESTQA